MQPPILARVQRQSRSARADGHSSAVVGARHAVVAAPPVSGLGTAHGRGTAPCPPPQRQYGQSPALSRKGSVMWRGFELVKPREILSHMSVAESRTSVSSPQKPRRFPWDSLLARVESCPTKHMRPSNVACLMSEDGCACGHNNVGQLSHSCEVERLAHRTAQACQPRHVSTRAVCGYAGPWASPVCQ